MITRDEADELAARLLGGLPTKLGDRQIDHARRVARAVEGRGDRLVAVALLHDVLEKSATTPEELLALTEDAAIVELVVVLSQREDEPDEAYLARCARHPAALVVKRLDLLDKLRDGALPAPGTGAEAARQQAVERLALLERLVGEVGRGAVTGAVPPPAVAAPVERWRGGTRSALRRPPRRGRRGPGRGPGPSSAGPGG